MAEKTKCEICDREFKDAEGLVAHNKAKHAEKIHKEEKPFPVKKIRNWGIFVIIIAILIGIVWSISSIERLPPTDIQGHVESNPSSHILKEQMPIVIQKHMLEHADGKGRGGVIINYNCKDYGCEENLIGRLESFAAEYDYVYVAPFKGMDAKIALTKLGEIDVLEEYDEARIKILLRLDKTEWKQIFSTWKKVFTNWKYLTATAIIALAFYLVNVLVSSWSSLTGFYSTFGFFGTIKFFLILFFGFKETIMFHSFVSLIVISIFFGLLFSLVGYKISIGQGTDGKKIGLFGSIGLFLAAFAPGCAACGVGLASVFGIGAGALSFLPYDGFELSIASIGILGFTIINITKIYTCAKLSIFQLAENCGGEEPKQKIKNLIFVLEK